MAFSNRRLRVGEVVALSPGEKAPRFKVVRVTPCSATLKAHNREPVAVEIPGKPVFWATSGGKTIQVSPTSFVYRDEA